MIEAYNKGYRYAIMNYPRHYNPYEVGSVDYEDFYRGYDESKESWG